MCFSATASFTAAVALGAAGVASVSQVKNKRELPLALVPLFFALQQFIEGLLWLSIPGQPEYTLPLTYVYLFFAFLWWPIYAPFVVYSLETKTVRQKIIVYLGAGGLVAGGWLYGVFLAAPIAARVVNSCIYYPISLRPFIIPAGLYLLATIGAGLVSSKRIANLLAVLAGLSALVAWWFYYLNFTSVWCFFAAVLSILIFFYFKK